MGASRRLRLNTEPRSGNPAFAFRTSRRPHLFHVVWKSWVCEAYELTSHWTKMTESPVASIDEATSLPSFSRRPQMATRYPLACKRPASQEPIPLFSNLSASSDQLRECNVTNRATGDDGDLALILRNGTHGVDYQYRVMVWGSFGNNDAIYPTGSGTSGHGFAYMHTRYFPSGFSTRARRSPLCTQSSYSSCPKKEHLLVPIISPSRCTEDSVAAGVGATNAFIAVQPRRLRESASTGSMPEYNSSFRVQVSDVFPSCKPWKTTLHTFYDAYVTPGSLNITCSTFAEPCRRLQTAWADDACRPHPR